MFISAVVFQNHILQQIEIGRAGWGFGRRPFCFWSAFHDVLFCIRALSPSVKGLNIGTRTRLVFYITFFFFFLSYSPVGGESRPHTDKKRRKSHTEEHATVQSEGSRSQLHRWTLQALLTPAGREVLSSGHFKITRSEFLPHPCLF